MPLNLGGVCREARYVSASLGLNEFRGECRLDRGETMVLAAGRTYHAGRRHGLVKFNTRGGIVSDEVALVLAYATLQNVSLNEAIEKVVASGERRPICSLSLMKNMLEDVNLLPCYCDR